MDSHPPPGLLVDLQRDGQSHGNGEDKDTVDRPHCYNIIRTIPYSRKYWRGIIFGGLAVFLSHRQYLICQYCTNRIDSWRRRGNRTVTAKFISANCNFLPFSSNPPNIIPTNISGYIYGKFVFLPIINNKMKLTCVCMVCVCGGVGVSVMISQPLVLSLTGHSTLYMEQHL